MESNTVLYMVFEEGGSYIESTGPERIFLITNNKDHAIEVYKTLNNNPEYLNRGVISITTIINDKEYGVDRGEYWIKNEDYDPWYSLNYDKTRQSNMEKILE